MAADNEIKDTVSDNRDNVNEESELDASLEPVEVDDSRRPEQQGIKIWPLALMFVSLAGGVFYLLTADGGEDAFVYAKQVNEVMVEPGDHAGRVLKVEGDLKPGSIRFRQDPCEWRFVLTKEDKEMKVSFPQCVVPDTFRDGMGISVTVQGELNADGKFLASEVIPRCPSKYEMKEKAEKGETMPHDEPNTLPPPPEPDDA